MNPCETRGKKYNWCLTNLEFGTCDYCSPSQRTITYLHFFSLSTQYSLGIANLRKIFQSMDLPFLAKNAKHNVGQMVNHIIGA